MDEFIQTTEAHQEQLRWLYQRMAAKASGRSTDDQGVGLVPAKLWGHDVVLVTCTQRDGEDILIMPVAILVDGETMVAGEGLVLPGQPEVEQVPSE